MKQAGLGKQADLPKGVGDSPGPGPGDSGSEPQGIAEEAARPL